MGKKALPGFGLLVALLTAGHRDNIAADTDSAARPRPAAVQESAVITATASVEAIDLDKREITLKGPLGDALTLAADERLKRLNEVKVGDIVRTDGHVSTGAELGKPTPDLGNDRGDLYGGATGRRF